MKTRQISSVALFVLLLTNLFCLPLWTECGYGGFVRTLFNKEARLDLLYFGKVTQAEPFQYEVTPKPFCAAWGHETGNNINVHRVNLSLRAKGKWQKLSLQLKVQRDGKITIFFRGPNAQNEYGAFYSILIDWRNVKINGKTILPKRKAFSFKKLLTKQIPVKKGDVLHIEAEFRRHHFSIHDFTGLKSGKVWYIITGNLLSFSLIYLLLTYIAKRRESVRLSDMLLLIGFFLLLFIPMLGISDAVRSERELRTLAAKPELMDLFKERSDYGRRYENWFNDHFCARVSLMKIHDVLRNKLSCIIRTKRALYFKESGWNFLIPLVSDLDCRPAFLQSIVQNLFRLNEFCQQNQIKLYVLEVPKKEIVYKGIIKENYGFDEKMLTKVSQAQKVIRDEARKNEIPYVYPYKALCNAARQDFVFFKCAWHWTDWGAFVGYSELMKEIRKDFPDMPVVSLNDYRKSPNWLLRDDYGRDYKPLWRSFQPFYNEDLDTPSNRTFYNYYTHRQANNLVCKLGRFIKDFSYPAGKHKVMLIGTSQNEDFLQFLPYCASQTKYIRLNKEQVKTADEFKVLRLYKKDILAFKPDILILSISTGNLPRLRDLCATK